MGGWGVRGWWRGNKDSSFHFKCVKVWVKRSKAWKRMDNSDRGSSTLPSFEHLTLDDFLVPSQG